MTRPVFASVIAIFIVLFGIISLRQIPYQLLPQITHPTISIYTEWAGASPYEIEKEITQNQEKYLKNLKNLQSLTSTSRDGMAIINLEFGLETDLKSAFIEVSSKLEEVGGYPDGVEKPLIKTTGETIPVAIYLFVKTLDSDMPDDLQEADSQEALAESAKAESKNAESAKADSGKADSGAQTKNKPKTPKQQKTARNATPSKANTALNKANTAQNLQNTIKTASDIDIYKDIINNDILQYYERVEGVGEVFISGGTSKQVQITLNAAQLAYNNITIQEIINAISARNHNISAGNIDFDQRNYRIQTIGAYRSINEVLETILKVQNGKITRLKDVASVQIGYAKKTSFNIHNNDKVISIQIRPTADANILELTDKIENLTNKLNAEVLEQRGLKIDWGRDQRGFILNAIDQVKQSIIIGMVLAIAVLLLFLRNLTSLFVVALVIPLSIIGTFVVLHIFGRTLNIISLAGISFAISMVIDSAIVVLESIIRNNRQAPNTPIDSSIKGLKEVIGALFASSITTIAIFIPIIYLKDEVGQLFADIGIAASSAIVIAFIVCIFVIPSFLLRTRHTPKHSKLSDSIGSFGAKLSSLIMKGVVKCTHTPLARAITIFGFLGFCAAFSILAFPKTDYMPKGEQNFIISYVSTPPGFSLDEKRYIAKSIIDKISPFLSENGYKQTSADATPEIKDFFLSVGSSIYFYLVADDSAQAGRVVEFAREVIAQIPSISGVVLRQEIFSGAGSSSVDVNISGANLENIYEAASKLKDSINENFTNINIRAVPALQSNNREINLYPNSFALLENKLDVASFGNIVDVILGGKTLGNIKIDDNYIDLVLKSKDDRRSPEDILYAQIYAPSGRIVMLGALSEVQNTLGVSTIRHFEQKRNTLLILNPSGNKPLEEIITTLRVRIIPPVASAYKDLQITLNGNADKLSALKGELMGGFLLAVAITYLILCALYGSFFYPLFIIASVPLATAGGLMGLFLVNRFVAPQNLDVITMLGFIILVGSVVNNAILIIYQARINYESYKMEWRASVLDSTRTRLSPIYMSMLTSVLALLPLAVFAGDGSEIYRGLGAVISGGIAFSTIISVFIIPALLLSVPPKDSKDFTNSKDSKDSTNSKDSRKPLSIKQNLKSVIKICQNLGAKFAKTAKVAKAKQSLIARLKNMPKIRQKPKLFSQLFLTPLFFGIFSFATFGAPRAEALNMQEAIQKALDYSAQIKSRQSYVSAATYNKYTTYANFLPVVNAGYSYSFNSPSISPDYSLNSFNVSASMNLFRGFIDYLKYSESNQNLARQKLTLHSNKANVVLSTKLAFIRILQSKALLITAQESAKLLNEQLKKANSFYQQGLRAKNEVLTMQLQLSTAKISLENAQMNLKYALNELSNLIGEEVDEKSIEEIEDVKLYAYDRLELVRQILANNPDYLLLKSQLESAQIAFKTTKGQFLPQVDLVGTKYWYIDGAGAANTYYGLQSQVRLNVTLNLFNGLKDGFAYQTKRYDVFALKHNLAQYERNAALQIDALLRDYENAKSQLNISQISLNQAKENYTIINNRYLQNLSTYTELINAQLLLTTMQTNINQARYNIISIQSNIERLANPQDSAGGYSGGWDSGGWDSGGGRSGEYSAGGDSGSGDFTSEDSANKK
ncbi:MULTISPECIES: efflux RND transporter permease subunit [unclassified Helicobacter]|uniref:efflux RND transporter permease subunit n=1 Tax=unclassified Helicobacter TaxID=2593540 RepID=UPI0013154359|nr:MULTISPECIES: efflux RND transporter permease subunit [unclassified Helicobacter]